MNANGFPFAVPVTPDRDTRAVPIASRGCAPGPAYEPPRPGACGSVSTSVTRAFRRPVVISWRLSLGDVASGWVQA